MIRPCSPARTEHRRIVAKQPARWLALWVQTLRRWARMVVVFTMRTLRPRIWPKGQIHLDPAGMRRHWIRHGPLQTTGISLSLRGRIRTAVLDTRQQSYRMTAIREPLPILPWRRLEEERVMGRCRFETRLAQTSEIR